MYIIYAPQYTHRSAGTRILYELSYQLNKHGYESYMLAWDNVPYYGNRYKICSLDFATSSVARGAWVVYPEIVKGNPLKAANVIRYVLNVPGLLGGDKTYASSEILFSWNSYISKHSWNSPIVKTPCIDLSIFKDGGLPRKGSCYFVYKGVNVPRRPQLEEIEITGQYPPHGLSDLFNSVEVFYTYDDMTAASDEARLCGCPVVLLNEDTDKYDLLKENKYGMAFFLSELPWAKKTVHKFRKLYIKQYYTEFEKQLKLFLKLTNYGNGKPN